VIQLIDAVLLLILATLCLGSLLNLSTSPHWFVRGWDFPRVQIVVLGWLLTIGNWLLVWTWENDSLTPWWLSLALAMFLTVWHCVRIAPYTPFARKHSPSTGDDVDGSEAAGQLSSSDRDDPSLVRLVISNVQQSNEKFDQWMSVITEASPNILIGLEINQRWADAIKPLFDRFPYRVIVTQENCYGMMILSQYKIEQHKVRYLVEQDIPSIDASIRLPDRNVIRCIGVHPRPPEPVRDTDATVRDAELALWGRELAEQTSPVIIGGDLNDVAWSRMTRLFLSISGLLDPRRGRGFFNTFHADYRVMRFPLDHIFHSSHFLVDRIQRLPHVGSDHFPMQIDLRLRKDGSAHASANADQKEDRLADLRVERAVEKPSVHGDAVDDRQTR
jgi:endonuclease/exonuclease/phosphatase (EEP) superfamily protein YafD